MRSSVLLASVIISGGVGEEKAPLCAVFVIIFLAMDIFEIIYKATKGV